MSTDRVGGGKAVQRHKSNHAVGGSDALSPSDIGAAAIASPTLTGTPAAPTAAVGTNTTQIATTAFVNAEISNDAVLNSLIQNSKGALITSTGSAVDDLTVGADGTVLTADSGETLGIKWAAVGGGKDDADNIIAVQVFG